MAQRWLRGRSVAFEHSIGNARHGRAGGRASGQYDTFFPEKLHRRDAPDSTGVAHIGDIRLGRASGYLGSEYNQTMNLGERDYEWVRPGTTLVSAHETPVPIQNFGHGRLNRRIVRPEPHRLPPPDRFGPDNALPSRRPVPRRAGQPYPTLN